MASKPGKCRIPGTKARRLRPSPVAELAQHRESLAELVLGDVACPGRDACQVIDPRRRSRCSRGSAVARARQRAAIRRQLRCGPGCVLGDLRRRERRERPQHRYAHGGVRRSSPATMWRIASTSSSRVVPGLIPSLVPASVTFPNTTPVATSAWKADGTLSGSPSTFSWSTSASVNSLRAGDGDRRAAPGRVATPRTPAPHSPGPGAAPPARLDLATTTLRTHPSEHATSIAAEPPRDPRKKHHHPLGNLI